MHKSTMWVQNAANLNVYSYKKNILTSEDSPLASAIVVEFLFY